MLRLLRSSSQGVVLLALMSVVVAGLQFVVPLYMMAIYNRILQTGSIETLQLISLIAAVLLFVLGIAEIARSRILALMAKRIGEYLNHDVYNAVLASPSSQLAQAIRTNQEGNVKGVSNQSDARTQALTDLRQVSAFVASGALNTFYDAILAPIFLAALFLLHPLLGWIGVGSTIIILSLAFLAEVLARNANRKIGVVEGRAQAKIERSIGQFDAVTSMGIAQPLFAKWEKDREAALALGLKNQSVVGVIGGMARAIRLIVQMGILGVGAWLALTTEGFFVGAIIAASIILGRALAPIDQSISVWPRFVQARAGAHRLVAVMDAANAQPIRRSTPPPSALLALQNVTLAFPQQRLPMLQSASFSVRGGEVMGIVGPNGAGKTTLLRALAGLHKPRSGTILLGATPVDGFTEDDRHTHFGYLPQDIQLLPGSVADNISRFRLSPETQSVMFEAAEQVGATGMVEALSEGFGTELTDETLSAGQTQTIGLGRAIFGDPLLVLLDEPTANLDSAGRAIVTQVIAKRRQAGLITVFVSHDQALLNSADTLLFLSPSAAKYGARDEVLRFIAGSQKQPPHQAATKESTSGAA